MFALSFKTAIIPEKPVYRSHLYTQPQNRFDWITKICNCTNPHEAHCVAKVRFRNLVCETACNGKVDPVATYYSDEIIKQPRK